MAKKLTTVQRVAVVGFALDQRSPWLRRQLLGDPLSEQDQRERGHLLAELDALAR